MSAEKYIELERLQQNPGQRLLYRQIRDTLGDLNLEPRFVSADIEEEQPVQVPTVPAANPRSPTIALEQALSDVQRALVEGRPAVGVDRIHTALHAVLRDLAQKAGLPTEDTMPKLFKILREQHPALRETGPRAADVTRMLQAMATVVDAANTLRNNASLAHPAGELLGDAEAMLVINAVNTLLHYLEKRMQDHTT